MTGCKGVSWMRLYVNTFTCLFTVVTSFAIAGAEAATVNPDNILVSHASRLAEYTRTGVFVQEVFVDPPVSSNSLRGVVVSDMGKLHVLNTPTPSSLLSTNTLGTSVWEHNAPADGMNLSGVTYYGGISADADYVYVPDRSNSVGDPAGIVRFSLANPSVNERFAVGRNYHTVKVGLNGVIYGLTRNGDLQGWDPVTLTQVADLDVFHGSSVVSVAVDANGVIYTLDLNNDLHEFDASGNFIREVDPNLPLSVGTDMQLSRDGTLLLGSGGDAFTLTDTDLSSFSQYSVPSQSGAFNNVFVAFASPVLPVPEPATGLMLLIPIAVGAMTHRRRYRWAS